MTTRTRDTDRPDHYQTTPQAQRIARQLTAAWCPACQAEHTADAPCLRNIRHRPACPCPACISDRNADRLSQEQAPQPRCPDCKTPHATQLDADACCPIETDRRYRRATSAEQLGILPDLDAEHLAGVIARAIIRITGGR